MDVFSYELCMEGGLVWQGINFKYECSWFVCTLCDIASLQQTNLYGLLAQQSVGDVLCPHTNDRKAPPRIPIRQLGFHCYRSQTISDDHMFRQDSERRQSKISHVTVSKKGSVCKNEVAQKKVGHVLVLSARQGAMMERPSVNPSSSIAVHYIH